MMQIQDYLIHRTVTENLSHRKIYRLGVDAKSYTRMIKPSKMNLLFFFFLLLIFLPLLYLQFNVLYISQNLLTWPPGYEIEAVLLHRLKNKYMAAQE